MNDYNVISESTVVPPHEKALKIKNDRLRLLLSRESHNSSGKTSALGKPRTSSGETSAEFNTVKSKFGSN